MRARTISTVLLLSFSVRSAAAQGVGSPQIEAHPNDLALAALNAALGGVAAGILRAATHRGFAHGFVGGAFGGAVSYAGRRISAEEFAGAGLMGREVGAIGASMTRSAAFGTGVLDTLVLPIGPLRAYLASRDLTRAAVRVDAAELTWIGLAIATPRFRFDLGRSLSSGSVVFVTDRGIRGPSDDARGMTLDGTVFLLADQSSRMVDALAHERVHITQLEYLKIAFGLPYERWIGRAIGLSPNWFGRHFDVGIGHYPMWLLLSPLAESEALRLRRH